MHRRKLIVIVLAATVIVSLVSWYAFQVLRFSPESKAAEISKQNAFVQQFLDIYSPEEVGYDVRKYYIKPDGSYHELDEKWELGRHLGRASETTDGKDHYCWGVIWYPELYMTGTHYVMVFVDRCSWEIVSTKWVFFP